VIELAVRLVFSLAVVVGLLLLVVRVGSRRFRGRNGAMVQVVHRQSLSRSSTVTVVTVGTRVLVLGTTEQQVTVLAELEPDEIELAEDFGPDGLEGLDGDSDDEGTVAELRPARALRVAPQPRPARPLRSVAVPATRSVGRHAAVPESPAGPLTGSVLSPDTWRQALAAATRRIS
jgi:flagellar protein FliO/FliZ